MRCFAYNSISLGGEAQIRNIAVTQFGNYSFLDGPTLRGRHTNQCHRHPSAAFLRFIQSIHRRMRVKSSNTFPFNCGLVTLNCNSHKKEVLLLAAKSNKNSRLQLLAGMVFPYVYTKTMLPLAAVFVISHVLWVKPCYSATN